ncbi:uncharacterized protein KY384_006477 [Bacidia gigantensis]|uniref:uncharacterized protein n=1 Tax=Bacidia gigantensis TaxID=2732470 RepID=UPI001D037D92|nr:uncharacterized protein KY384_006477 [Bacidia gigantensis]KAG8528789.1 hypothetical protein KY384_006477 [Bacidia gigantensis]
MVAVFTSIATFFTLRLLALILAPTSLVEAVPVESSAPSDNHGSSSFWMSSIQRQGKVPFGKSDFKIYRNVKDYGAKGDGKSDDTTAINKAITDGDRCGKGCDSSTTTPAIIAFPPGTYMVSAPLIQYYYTQFIGDALNLPTIKATPKFKGMAVIDTDPYDDEGKNWFTNQNNFYRQIRNFVIDITGLPPSQGAGIHWQVAQATSLQNIRFEMVKGGQDNKQQGIFMDNGSGGFLTDLTFNGGNYGAFFGSQQFTSRNMTFNGCNCGIFMNWNWLWNLKSLNINECGVGVNISNSPSNLTVGSIIIQDSVIRKTSQGIMTAYNKQSNTPPAANTVILDNVDFTDTSIAVADQNGQTILKGGSKVASWIQGSGYSNGAKDDASASQCASAAPSASATKMQGPLGAPTKPASLLSNGNVYERSKPQYETVPATSFISVKSQGAKGDGQTDDSDALQKAFDAAKADQVVYFDHGNYVVTKTVKVPKNIKITGEIWPIIMASGQTFSNAEKPVPVFQVGQPGDSGAVEMSDLVFSTKGPAPGAILVEWNLASSSQGSNGMWDVHFRIGGTAGSGLQSDKCAKNPNTTTTSTTVSSCSGAFLLLHVTSKGSVYIENSWYWVADHELDRSDHNQINIFNGRGVLLENSEGPVWLYGTSSEHSQLYNYQISNAKNVYMGMIQTETPYMQANPNALTGGFKPNDKYDDPDFSDCKTDACKKAWGLRVSKSSDVLVYGAGLYSFFDNYGQACLKGENCQENMVSIECSTDVYLWGLSTKASTNMVTLDGQAVVQGKNHMSNFCSTVAVFEAL